MATSYKTIDDVAEEYVRPRLGGWAKYFDLVSIAYEITYYRTVHPDRSERILKDVHDPDSEFFDADMFWDVVMRFDREVG